MTGFLESGNKLLSFISILDTFSVIKRGISKLACFVITGGVKGNSLRSYDNLQADGSDVGTDNSEAHAACSLASNLDKEDTLGSKSNELKNVVRYLFTIRRITS